MSGLFILNTYAHGPRGKIDLPLSAHLERGLEEHFRSKPAHIGWAMRDIAFTPAMLDGLWRHTLPDAPVTRLEDAGHYLQQDAHERIVPELLGFLDRSAAR